MSEIIAKTNAKRGKMQNADTFIRFKGARSPSLYNIKLNSIFKNTSGRILEI